MVAMVLTDHVTGAEGTGTVSYDSAKADVGDWPSGETDVDREIATLFWRAFDVSERDGRMAEFLGIYRPLTRFAGLVAEADRRLAGKRKGAA